MHWEWDSLGKKKMGKERFEQDSQQNYGICPFGQNLGWEMGIGLPLQDPAHNLLYILLIFPSEYW